MTNVLTPEPGTTRPATPLATEKEAREVAEAAREQHWEQPSFVRELFEGNLRVELIHPFPEPDPAEVERARPFMERLERFMREKVDSDRIDREGQIPADVVQGLKDLGAFGIKIPTEYGGLGLSQLMYTKAIGLVTSQDGSMTALLSAAQSIGVPTPLKLFGTPEQKKKYLPRLAKGAISAFALTEANVGSDPAGLATHAELSADGTHYILNGEKLWCTNGTVAELYVVMARTTGKKITAFIVERDWPGVEVVHRLRFMGLKAIENGVIRFTNVKVPVENVIWGEGKGLKLALVTLNTGRLTLPASCVAGAKRCLEIVRKWSNERVQWGQPVGKHDAIAQKLGRMAAETFAMEAVSDLASLMADAGDRDIRLEAAIAKMWNTELGWRIVDDTLQIKGGRGYETADSLRLRGERPDPVERMMRDFRINLIFEGSSEIMRLFIAREAVDTHLKVAGALIDPKSTGGQKFQALLKSAAFYGLWYPKLWLPFKGWFSYGEFGRLAGHMRFVERSSRQLARTLFHCMIRFGPKLEKKQAVLGRLVEIGAELLAISAACARAHAMVKKTPTQTGPRELADVFSRQARRRVEQKFREVWANDDDVTYQAARHFLDDHFLWLEAGMVREQA
ncbi:MAG: acyl-CoA dehydrogenase family protein [Gemmatimonadetes bacterium]|jgi:alkylation response protein AidB-like acyl-CoA dehydrogenase|nr:acyl-CoA dehydrogenase family protein [Gemmatimonadota bacterium]MBP6670200.1 acyl-CoA dehydrogenase family protein [Gemmatimonadales bacterium]MBK7350408.1 acyl-CoA dehydrogenase family protein [Gemmatimonadota bacterium]MBK7716339.1 acyl-CoA dehydrogenase family protein [Gemmatimonadota bacterium]MBK7785551.1 acyl-CoA dehydrogenase family protein [Gemmatimonadota bacterium]